VAERLVRAGADVCRPDLEGTTPLHGAAQVGSLDCCHLLVGAGAETSAKDRMGRTPAELAKELGQADILAYLSSLQKT